MPLTQTLLDSMPLAEYAAEHWIGHAKSGGMDSTLLQLILCLFTSKSASLKNWIQIHNIDERWSRKKYKNLSMEAEVCSGLYYSSLAGMERSEERRVGKECW